MINTHRQYVDKCAFCNTIGDKMIFLDEHNIFYHGTRTKFDIFRPLSHFGSYKAAQKIIRYPFVKEECLDLDTEQQKYEFNKNKTSENASSFKTIIPVKIKLNKTYELQDYAATCSDIKYFQAQFLYHIINDLKINGVPKFYDYIFSQPFQMSDDAVAHELLNESLYKLAKDNMFFNGNEINRYHLSFQRMIQYFENLGYDGFNYTNLHEDKGHTSYIVFRPENIIRLDGDYQLPNTKTQKWCLENNCSDIRSIKPAEFKILHKYENFQNNAMAKKSAIFAEYPDLHHRPSVIKSAIRTREYYTRMFIDKILPLIEKIGTQPKYGYHGLYTHTFQVVQFAIECAISVGTDPLPIMLGAALHDIGRKDMTNDDFSHALHGAKIAQKFLENNFPDMFPGTLHKIVYAIKNHTIGTKAPDLISACVWDADRIRLAWEKGYDEKYFNTAYGKYIARIPQDTKIPRSPYYMLCYFLYEAEPQKKQPYQLSRKIYIAKQNKFLSDYNLKIK